MLASAGGEDPFGDSSMTHDEADAIATRFPVSPAPQAASAVRATRLVSQTAKVERAILRYA
jgi:hypothetical protein